MATPDAVSVKQPRCQEKAIFEFGFPSSIAISQRNITVPRPVPSCCQLKRSTV